MIIKHSLLKLPLLKTILRYKPNKENKKLVKMLFKEWLDEEEILVNPDHIEAMQTIELEEFKDSRYKM